MKYVKPQIEVLQLRSSLSIAEESPIEGVSQRIGVSEAYRQTGGGLEKIDTDE